MSATLLPLVGMPEPICMTGADPGFGEGGGGGGV